MKQRQPERVLLFLCLLAAGMVQGKGNEMIFDESVIEGKIKRPQVVLITADQRPVFEPMAINSSSDTTNLFDRVNTLVFEQDRLEDAFNLDFNNRE
jgi:hypothetical protein